MYVRYNFFSFNIQHSIAVSFQSRCHLFCRNDPPGQNTSVATQELLRLVEANPLGLGTLDPINDLRLRDMELVEQFQTLKQLEDGFQHFKCVHDPSFVDNVRIYCLVMEVLKKINKVVILESGMYLF